MQSRCMTKKSVILYLSIIGLLLASAIGWYAFAFRSQTGGPINSTLIFSGVRAYEDVQTQVSFGPRVPGSEGHAKIREWMRAELESAGWQVETQESEALAHPIK